MSYNIVLNIKLAPKSQSEKIFHDINIKFIAYMTKRQSAPKDHQSLIDALFT